MKPWKIDENKWKINGSQSKPNLPPEKIKKHIKKVRTLFARLWRFPCASWFALMEGFKCTCIYLAMLARALWCPGLGHIWQLLHAIYRNVWNSGEAGVLLFFSGAEWPYWHTHLSISLYHIRSFGCKLTGALLSLVFNGSPKYNHPIPAPSRQDFVPVVEEGYYASLDTPTSVHLGTTWPFFTRFSFQPLSWCFEIDRHSWNRAARNKNTASLSQKRRDWLDHTRELYGIVMRWWSWLRRTANPTFRDSWLAVVM